MLSGPKLPTWRELTRSSPRHTDYNHKQPHKLKSALACCTDLPPRCDKLFVHGLRLPYKLKPGLPRLKPLAPHSDVLWRKAVSPDEQRHRHHRALHDSPNGRGHGGGDGGNVRRSSRPARHDIHCPSGTAAKNPPMAILTVD